MRRALGVLAVVGVLAGCSAPAAAPTRTATVPGDAALVAARMAAGIADCPDADPTATQVISGLPAITLSCLGSDKTVNLAGLRGEPMVVNLWAQWCLPCRQEAAHLRDVASRVDGRVLVLGVNYDDPQPDWAVEFAQLAGWRYAHVVDRSRALASPLQLQGIPTTLFVDAQGRIVYRHAGPFESASQLEGLVERYLGVTP